MRLTLAEQLLLIATHDRKGSKLMAASTALPYGIAGGLLLEASMGGKLMWREKRLAVIDRSPTGDALIDEALEQIAMAPKERDAKYWVSRLARKIKKIERRTSESLVEKGVLRHEEKHFLWVIPYQRFPERDPQPERLVRERLYDVISGRIAPSDRHVALISLVFACGLLNEVVPKGERREAKKRVKEMLKGEAVGKAVSAVVEEINAAVMVAVVAAGAASAASSS